MYRKILLKVIKWTETNAAKWKAVKDEKLKSSKLGTRYIWRPWKLSSFQDPSPPLSIYVQHSYIPLTWDVQFQTNPHPPFQMITSQLKENNSRMTIICYQVLLSGRLSFSLSFRFFIITHILVLVLQSICVICKTWKCK